MVGDVDILVERGEPLEKGEEAKVGLDWVDRA